MKKLTWALLSLMLFLGIGAASAQTLPTPTFTPSGMLGTQVAPGQEIEFTVPSSFWADYAQAYILYIFAEEADDPDIKATQDELTAWQAYLFSEDHSAPKRTTTWEAMLGQDQSGDDDGSDVMWMPSITIPSDASGALYFYACLAADDGTQVVYSSQVEAVYIVQGEVAKPDMPTFSPVAGQVDPGAEITISADADMIWYVIDGEDADLTMNGYMAGKCQDYENPITIRKAQTIKAVAVKGNQPPFTFSDVATAAYTVSDKEQTDVPKLTITPAGPISVDGSATFSCTLDPQEYTHESGQVGFTIKFDNGSGIANLEYQVGETADEDNWTAYREADLSQMKNTGVALGAIPRKSDNNATYGRVITLAATTVHYRLTLAAGAANPEVTFQAVEVKYAFGQTTFPTTDANVLAEASVQFENVAAPAITVAQPEITPDNTVGAIKLNQKVTITCATEGASIYYTLDNTAPDATKTLYTEPFSLPEGTEVDDEITIRAIAIKDGVSSLERRVALMVQEAGDLPDDPQPVAKPNAPKFEVDGEAVTAATLKVEAEKVAVKWIGDETNED
ncbi:MAG: chitobiase/beta-hexosaminidase C-terminal domain-containing protein, partial [Bacteroidales bacterium]|nr:chitobiase/beta-hexosaminidase C-terminal domain-containing protein [Bacteroidales bacterium]